MPIVLALAAVSACGAQHTAATTSSTKPEWSVSDVRRTFARHGVVLRRVTMTAVRIPYVWLAGEEHGLDISVQVHPKTPTGDVYFSSLGNGKPHGLSAR